MVYTNIFWPERISFSSLSDILRYPGIKGKKKGASRFSGNAQSLTALVKKYYTRCRIYSSFIMDSVTSPIETEPSTEITFGPPAALK